MYISNIEIKNFRMFKELTLKLNKGLNVFVGENNSGKTAILDAIRYVLGTNSTENIMVEEDDFHKEEREFSIKLIFSDLSSKEAGAFAEYLTYTDDSKELIITLICNKEKNGRNRYGFIKRQIKTGKDATGPDLEGDTKEFLNVTFLKPLRDAEAELSSSKNSRLAKILEGYINIKENEFPTKGASLISKVEQYNKDIKDEIDDLQPAGSSKIDSKIQAEYLDKLLLERKNIVLKFIPGKDYSLFKNLLKKLNLLFEGDSGKEGKQGLGYQNLLFMAAELLLLSREENNPSRTLIIEEPEAHLHPQHQIKFLKFIKDLLGPTESKFFQVFISTHSPNLSSQIPLENIFICTKNKAFSLREGETALEREDYEFLCKFLDVTKADLFFARGLIFVEGISEQLVIPAIAENVLGTPLESLGISVISVSGKAFKRFAKIFKGKDLNERIHIPISFVRDRDEYADEELKKLKEGIESTTPEFHKVFISDKQNFEYSFLDTNKELILTALVKTYATQNQTEIRSEIEKLPGEEIYRKIDKDRGKSFVSFYISNLLDNSSVIPEYLKNSITHITEKLGSL